MEGILTKSSFLKLDSRPYVNSGAVFHSEVLEDVSYKSFTGFLKKIFPSTEKTQINEISLGTKNYTLDEDKIEYTFMPDKTTDFSCLNYYEGIFFENENEILTFLDVHSEVKEYISDAEMVINKYFFDSKLKLELITNFESEKSVSNQTLFINIITDEKPKEALRLLDKADKEIFDNLEMNSRLFNIDIEFKS